MSKTKKYKLRKWYPSLPESWKKGTIVICNKSNYAIEQHCIGDAVLPKNQVENNPEFWEEIVEKDYEILSFKDVRPEGGQIMVKKENGNYWFHGEYVEGVTEEEMLYEGACVDLGDFVVHAVRRKSDGEVFTIGDKILYKHGNIERVIDRFILTSSNLVKVEGHNKSDKTHFLFRLSSIDKVKTPLFTTEDGVDIYEGDEFYYIPNTSQTSNKLKVRRSFGGKDGDKCEAWARYSTIEKAEEYVEENKPRYSKADIEEAMRRSFTGSRGIIQYINEREFWRTLRDE